MSWGRISILPLLLFALSAFGQIDAIEQIAEENEGEFEFQEWSEQLEQLANRPLNLNKADAQDLNQYGLVSEAEAEAIIRHRVYFGDFLSVYELQSVKGLTEDGLRRLKPYVETSGSFDDPNATLQQQLTQGSHQFFLRYQKVLEQQKGYEHTDTTSPNYEGSQEKIYTRYRYKFGPHLSYGITAEKDAGEAFFKGSQKQGFDYYSAHFFIRRKSSLVRALALGDYEVKMGQGLISWDGLAFAKSASVMNVKKTGPFLKPYSSVNETSFKRGAAIELGFNDFTLGLYGSIKNRDANVADIDSITEEALEISSLQESGLHRTTSEIEDRKSIKASTFGLSAQLKKKALKLGANMQMQAFNVPLNKKTNLYNQFEFSGDQLINGSVDYSYLWKNMHFFGETAVDDSLNVSTLNGVLMSLDPKVDLSIIQRHFAQDFRFIGAQPFSETRKSANERGIFLGLNMRLKPRWTLSSYVDFYKHPWLRFQTDAPSHGREILSQLNWRKSRNLEVYLRFKNEVKQKNGNEISVLDVLSLEKKTSLRLHVVQKITRFTSLKARAEFSRFEDDQGLSKGFLVYQEVAHKPFTFPVHFSARFTLFDAVDYDARIYAYESDVLYAYSIPGFANKGMRWYAVTRWKASKNLDLWLRFAQTWYSDIEQISSGNEEIDGNRKSELKAQLRLKF